MNREELTGNPTVRTAGRREGKHKHFTQGDRGYVPRTTSHPVDIRIAKRG